jgi:hypothetical protein
MDTTLTICLVYTSGLLAILLIAAAIHLNPLKVK